MKSNLEIGLLLVGAATILAVAGCNAYPKTRADQMTTLRNAKLLAVEVRELASRRGGVLPKSLDDPALAQVVAAYRSLNKAGGRFILDPSIAGSRLAALGPPESTVVVQETVPWPDGRVAVGFLDGHSELRSPVGRVFEK